MKRRSLALTTVALLALALVPLALRTRDASTDPDGAASTPLAERPHGERTYRVQLTRVDRVRDGSIAEGTLGTEVRLEGELIETDLEGRRALRFGVVDELELTVLGQDQREALGEEALSRALSLIELDAHGAGVGTREDAGSLASRVLASLALDLASPSCAATSERTTLGTALIACEERDGSRTHRASEYASLDALGARAPERSQVSRVRRTELDASGERMRIELEERVEVSSGGRTITSETRLVATRVAQHAPTLHAGAATPGTDTLDPQALAAARRERLLRAQADGLTAEGLASAIAMLGSGEPVDVEELAWRGVALLRLEPEAADALAEIFLDPDTDPLARRTVLDLLTYAGGAHAEQVLLRLLASDEARADEASTLGHLSLLVHPSARAADYAEARMRASSGSARTAALYAMGSIAARLRQQDPARAEALRVSLQTSLERAASETEEAHALVALGATRSEDALPAIEARATSASAGVRARCAHALASIGTPRARRQLRGLATDADPTVARAALTGLREADASAEDLDALTQRLREGAAVSGIEPELYALAEARSREAPDAARALLDALVAARPADRMAAARAGVLLAQLEGRVP